MRRTKYLLSAAILRPSDLKITTAQLVPELKLHLLTPQDKLWNDEWKNHEVPEPFWAIFWPGGQVLSRFIFDTQITKGKRGKLSLVRGSELWII
jgi:predicted nicotinamide N-methyase